MAEVAARPWFILAWVQLALTTLAGIGTAVGGRGAQSPSDLLLGASFAFVAAGGLAYGYAPPFLKRELLAKWPATLALGLVMLVDATLVGFAFFGLPPPSVAAMILGAAFLLLPLHLAASAAWAPSWRGGVALFAKDQPYRRGDQVAATAFALSLVGLAAAGAFLIVQPRGLMTTGIIVANLGFAFPFFTGVLAFFLPRNAKTPLSGATLVLTGLAVGALATLGLVLAFILPTLADFRFPALLALLADVLILVAFARFRFPKPGAQMRRALPLLRAAGALALLAGLSLALSMVGGLPGPLFPVAAYTHLVLLATLATAGILLGAPVLVNAVPREGAWPKLAAVLGIAGLFLLAPAFQYPRSAFPGAVVLALAASLALWGLAPMRTRRRECPPDG